MEICLWLGWLIFDFLLKGCPPNPTPTHHHHHLPCSLFLSFLPSVAPKWEDGKPAHWISSGWLGLSQWTPVEPGCQMCLSIGVNSRICLSGLRGFVGADRRRGGGCRAECCPLTRACHSRCLFLYSSLSVDCWGRCLMTIPSLRWHLSCHMFHLKWIPCNTCLWLTFSNELSRDDTANIGSVCHGDRGPSHMFSSQRSARVDECI